MRRRNQPGNSTKELHGREDQMGGAVLALLGRGEEHAAVGAGAELVVAEGGAGHVADEPFAALGVAAPDHGPGVDGEVMCCSA